jgi:hypothetical protein
MKSVEASFLAREASGLTDPSPSRFDINFYAVL